MLRHFLTHLQFVESQLNALQNEIARKLSEESTQIERLCTIPGIEVVTASSLVAEIGLNITALLAKLLYLQGSGRRAGPGKLDSRLR